MTTSTKKPTKAPEPGMGVLALGPSGSGKSTFLRSALEREGSGVVVLAPGTDELESYRSLYKDADFLVTPEDLERLVRTDADGKPCLDTSKPYLFAAFDDGDFFPSLGEWRADGLKSMVGFLRLVHQRVRLGDVPWRILALDTFSSAGDLASNAMLGLMKAAEPPKARGDGGAQYYIGYKNKLLELARACRAIRGYGLHWLATSHVQLKEASDTYGAADIQAKEQQMALFTGAFREIVPAFFDVVAFTGVDNGGKHYMQPQPDRFRSSKSRYTLDADALDAKGRLENDWSKLLDAISS